MRQLSVLIVVCVAGFEVMVLEIVGARFLARDFGSSLYVWVSQIGVILLALALGAFVGGAFADWTLRPSALTWGLVPAGIFTATIPRWAPGVLQAVVMRHPLDSAVPLFWQKADPAIGSTLVFFLPCLVLASLPTFMIRLESRKLERVGRISGSIYAVSTCGNIVGVFVSGYVLLDHMKLSSIFEASGVVMILLGIACVLLDRSIHRTKT